MKYIHLIVFVLFFNSFSINAQQPDTMPVYPGCEQVTEKMSCFKEHLLTFITENFDSSLLDKIETNKQVSMLINFVIDDNGKLSDIDIKSGYNFLNKEMNRVLQMLPVIKPAGKDGYPIPIQYELPVIFEGKHNNKKMNNDQKN